MTQILSPGSKIGIIGGGQLGRMLALAAAPLGFEVHIFTPNPNSPAAQVVSNVTIGEYDDTNAVGKFAASVDVITYEFENVPAQSAIAAAASAPVYPPIEALDTAQDRLTEKTYISENAGVPVGPFHPVDNEFDAKRAIKILDGKCVLKTRRMGYDGKGQVIVSNETEAMDGFKSLGGVGCIAEKFIPFAREVSVICARNTRGELAAYPLIENEHRNHILYRSVCPAENDTGQAQALALKVLEALDYVGVLAVEFFQLDDGTFLVNEIAPRVHNSGHWTQDAGCTSQFEMHIRAIAGWPLGDPYPKYKTEMINLLGDDLSQWSELGKDPAVKVHLYGKSDARPGRKMGHYNRILLS